MARKKWSAISETTPELLKSREKRKWQIALRRYVLEKKPCAYYAPYFGLDIEYIRKWFEAQFEQGVGWDDFAEKWQFDHIIPVTYFDFSDNFDLKLCWNFINLRAEPKKSKEEGNPLDVLAAKGYFEELHKKTHYRPCLELLEKIDKIKAPETINCEKQQAFILRIRPHLDMIENYSSFEFELLNSGRNIDEVIKEINFLKKFQAPA